MLIHSFPHFHIFSTPRKWLCWTSRQWKIVAIAVPGAFACRVKVPEFFWITWRVNPQRRDVSTVLFDCEILLRQCQCTMKIPCLCSAESLKVSVGGDFGCRCLDGFFGEVCVRATQKARVDGFSASLEIPKVGLRNNAIDIPFSWLQGMLMFNDSFSLTKPFRTLGQMWCNHVICEGPKLCRQLTISTISIQRVAEERSCADCNAENTLHGTKVKSTSRQLRLIFPHISLVLDWLKLHLQHQSMQEAQWCALK